MPFPTVGGTRTTRGTSTTSNVDISGIPNGAWLVVSVMSSANSQTITPPAGWSTLAGPETTGTRRNYLFGKIKDTSDTTTAAFTQSGTSTTAYGLIWGTGSSDIATWGVGATRVRSASGEPSGSRYTNIAPSLTTSQPNSLVLAISNEATLAKTQPHEVTAFTSGWTEQLWFEQVVANDQIETVWVGSKEMATTGTTGDVNVTYISPQDNNGWALQLAIPYSTAQDSTLPHVVGVPTTFTTNSTTTGFTINRPSGILNGDYIIVALRNQNGTSVAPSSPGFTRLGTPIILNNNSSRTHGFYGKPITDASNEPTTYTFSYSSGTSRAMAVAFIFRGVDVNSPVTGFYDNYNGDDISGGKSTGSYIIDGAPSLTLFMGSSEFASPNDHTPLTTPGGFTNIIELASSTNLGSSRTYMWIGSRQQATSPTSQAGITWATPAGPGAESISLRGISSTPPDMSGSGYTLHNGAGSDVKVYYKVSDGVRTPSNVIPMRRGFNSVADMLAKPGFTWAHRGGSASYPEHSLYGYTQSVARGYGVLEVSLARTSDGVWFGLHDQTTDRTSGGTYGNASSQTWAQIQSQQIVIGAQGAPQPYLSLNELVDIYGDTHIFVLDPKYALGSYRTEFLNLANSLLGPTRAIIKYSGPGSGAAGLSTAAQAMGFQTWGFFYASDASSALGGNGALQTWGPSWTLIGMEYGASQAIWNECLALGKPVIGHIAPNQSAYDTAIAKGASGVQVSGVGIVAPVSWWT